MSEDQFTKLFKYMKQEFTAVHAEVAEVKNLHLQTQSTLDSFAKQLLEQNQEHLMLSRKVDRMEQWVQQIAKKTGTELTY